MPARSATAVGIMLSLALVFSLSAVVLSPGAGRAEAAAVPAFVTRQGNQLSVNGSPFRFSGTNMYWLALDDNMDGVGYPTAFEIDDAMTTAQTMGATVVRAWADSVGCALCIEPSPGQFNPAAFGSLDYAVASARQHGIRLILSLVDNWSYFDGGKNTYTAWNGAAENAFFTSRAVIGGYESFITAVLTHVDPNTGVAYDADPTIMGWETGNEIWCQTCSSTPEQHQVEASWTAQVASFIKATAPRQLVVDGLGVTGSCVSSCLNSRALRAPAVDVVDDHFYPMDAARLTVDARQAAGSAKAYLAGEYDWANHDSGGSSLATFLATIEGAPVAGDLFWVLIPHDSSGGFQDHEDGFQFDYSDTGADMTARTVALRSHAYAMAGVIAPPVPLAAPPAITGATYGPTGVTVEWLGSAGGSSYEVQRSDGAGGWITVGTGLIDAVDGRPQGWTDTGSGPSGSLEYRMEAVNLSGQGGAWSAPHPTSNGWAGSSIG